MMTLVSLVIFNLMEEDLNGTTLSMLILTSVQMVLKS